jgi:alpha-tubulin suppressor-like RCC1 family protein
MISTNALIAKINDLISAGSLDEVEVSQLAKAVDTLERKGVGRVFSLSEITADNNPGRIVFVESEFKYYISDGTQWITNVKFLTEVDARTPMYAWGDNTNGILGDDTVIGKSSPVSVVGGFTDWISAAVGSFHSIGVRANGSLWAWGSNNQGQLGDSTTTNRSSPVSVVGGFSDWIQASASLGTTNSHSLGVRANGTIWAWGFGSNGRLGDNSTTNRSSPVSVVGGFSDWVSASAGGGHSIGVRANGSLWAWGYNTAGQLGDNSTTSRLSPVSTVGGFNDWISVSAGNQHSLGVRANGSLWAWGSNLNGRLGDNTVTNRSSPVSVVGGFNDWVSASAGAQHSLGVRASGSLWAWGGNDSGRLGDNSTTSRSSPVSVVGGFSDWISASAGYAFSNGIRANGTLWAWGENTNGQLGTNNTTSRSSPVSVVGGFSDWLETSAGRTHSFGVRA